MSRERAVRIVAEFLAELPEIRELLRTDIQAAFEGDPAALNREEIILSYPFVETIAIQRSSASALSGGGAVASANDDGVGAWTDGNRYRSWERKSGRTSSSITGRESSSGRRA